MVNNFDVLKIMGERNLKIKAAGLGNVISAHLKGAIGEVTIGVDAETIKDILTGTVVGMFVVADSKQFNTIKKELGELQERTV